MLVERLVVIACTCCYFFQAIYISFLLRKDKLVKYFRELQLFKDDIQLPAEVGLTIVGCAIIISH